MTNTDAIMAKGQRVRVRGYRPERVGTVVGFSWLGGGKKAMYVKVDFGMPMPNHDDGIIGYKAKHLVFMT